MQFSYSPSGGFNNVPPPNLAVAITNTVLQGGNGGRGGSGGDGGSGSGAYETTLCYGEGICTVTMRFYPGDGGNAGAGGNGGAGGAGVSSQYGRQISLYGTTAQGGDGGSGGSGGGGGPAGSTNGFSMPEANNGDDGADGAGGRGGAGIEADATSGGSTIIAISSDSRALGGNGGSANSVAGEGGGGVHAIGSADISVNGTVIGGRGGNNTESGSAATGGVGIVVSGPANITVAKGGNVAGGAGGGGNDSSDHGGSGGAGINVVNGSANLTIEGRIQGGPGGKNGIGVSGPSGSAIALSGSGNTLELRNGYQITGNVLAGTNATLIFGGDQNASFDLPGLGGQYQGFSILNKIGASTWTLSGKPTSFMGDTSINGGTLALTSGATMLTSSNLLIGSALGSQAAGLVTAGATWIAGSVSLGGYGDDTLTIRNGGKVNATGNLTIGSGPNLIAGRGEAVTVEGPGSRLSVNGSSYVGGALTIRNGGVVDSRQMQIGFDQTTSATVTATGAGSSLNAAPAIGVYGNGSLTVADGASAGILGNSGSFMIGNSADPNVAAALNIGAAPNAAAVAPGTLKSNVAFGSGSGSLNFNHTSSNYTFAPAIAGAGSINFLAGTTILTGNSSSFTGSTNVSSSTLSMKGSLGGSLAVNAGGFLQGSGSVGTTTINAGGTLAPTGVKPLTVNGALTLQAASAFDFNLGHSSTGAASTTSATVAVDGNLALNNATLNITNTGEPGVGYYRMMTYAGALSGTGLTIGAKPPDPGPFPVAYSVDISRANVVDLVVGSNGTNVLQLWGGGTTGVGGGTGVWNAGNSNWLDLAGTVPTGWGASYGVFLGPGGAVAVQGEQSLVGLQFVSGAYTIVSDTGTPGTLRLRGVNGLDGIAELRVLAGETATIDAPMVGAGGFNKTADGTLVLGGINTYTGGTTISGGTLQISSDANLGAASGALTLDNGTLHTTANIASTRGISLVTAGEFDVGASKTLSASGNVSGAGGLIKSGDGTLALSGANTWSGGTLITAGTLRADAGGALPTATDYALTGGRLDLNGYDLTMRSLLGFGGEIALGAGHLTVDQTSDTLFAGTITGAGTLEKTGSGVLFLTGTNTYGGGTTISGGTLAIISGGSLGSTGSPLKLSGGGTLATFADIATSGAMTISDTGTIYTYSGTTFTASGAITGAGALTKDGGGALALIGANTYGGGTTIAAGTLQLGNGGTAGSIVGDVVNNGIFAFNRSDSAAFGGTISGAGAVAQIGAGTTILTGTNSYGGGTVISAGTLQLGNGGAFGSIAGDVANSGTFAINRSDSYTFGGMISGVGAFTQVGTGTTILTGDNVYTGVTTVSSGTLQLGNGGTTGSILGNVVNNGALIVNHTNDVVLAGIISGAGSFVQSGLGTTRLNGNSSYTGATGVIAGTLSVNGLIASSSLMTVGDGATLGGNGIVGNTRINAGGMLAPGNSIGLLTVQGNLSFAAASSYMVEISGGNADRTNVIGTATLNGATVRTTFDPGSYVTKHYTIMSAAGGINGTFSGPVNSNLPSTFITSLHYDAQNVYLDLALNMSGLNVNQQNVANGLNKYFDVNGGIPLSFGGLSSEELTLISGELSTAVQQTTTQAMTQFMGVITDPFSGNRGGAMSPGAMPFGETAAFNAYASTNSKRSGAEHDAYGMITKAVPRAATFEARWNVWAAGFGGGQTTEGNAVVGSNAASSRVGGVAVGADYWLSPQTVAGFALAGGGTNFSLSNGLGSGRSDLFQAGGFVRHTVGSVYATAAVAYGWQDITTDRSVAVAGLDQLRGHFNVNAFSARVEAGNRSVVPWLSGAGLTPYAAAQVTHFDLPAYAESAVSGSNMLALAYASRNVNAVRSELGLRSDKFWAVGDATLTLRGRAAWAHDYNTDRVAAATFQSLPGAGFVVNGAAQAHDAALVTASSEMTFSNGISVAATYEGEFSGVTRSHAGKGVVRYTW